jgi:peptidoglycan/LPS O-acetylase OafA/YrhL
MKKIPQLDAVRGLAVLLVLLHNTDRYPSLHLQLISGNGWMGVGPFFVLSGLLITGWTYHTVDQQSTCANSKVSLTDGIHVS